MTQDNLQGKNRRIGIGLAVFVVMLGALALIYGILV